MLLVKRGGKSVMEKKNLKTCFSQSSWSSQTLKVNVFPPRRLRGNKLEAYPNHVIRNTLSNAYVSEEKTKCTKFISGINLVIKRAVLSRFAHHQIDNSTEGLVAIIILTYNRSN